MKRIIYLLLALALFGGVAYMYINKPVEDLSSQKPTETFEMKAIIEKTNADTNALSSLKNKVIAITGVVKKISKETDAMSIELGDTTSTSSIICQIDKRHIDDFKTIKENETINIKGLLNGFTIDTELGLGNTINIDQCVINK